MRKLLLILLLIPFFADAQVWQQNNLEYGHQFKGLKALRAFLLPLAETTAGQGRDTGAVYYRMTDSSIYVYTGSQWRQVAGGAGAVTSVFGRTDAVTALEADYNAFYPLLSGTYNNPSWLNQLAWSKITGTPTTLAGYGITDAQGTLTLTTTGTSGASTLVGNTLNIPQYSGGSADSSWISAETGTQYSTLGDIINTDFSALPSGWSDQTPDASVTFSGKMIVSGGTTGSGVFAGNTGTSTLYNNRVDMDYFNYDKLRISTTIIPQDRDGNSNGFAIHFKSNALFFSQSLRIRYDLSTNADSGRIFISTDFGTAVQSPSLSHIAGDTLDFNIYRDMWRIKATSYNRRTGKYIDLIYESSNGFGSGGMMYMGLIGGSQHYTSFKITSYNRTESDAFTFLGDSQFAGNGGTSEDKIFPLQVVRGNKSRANNVSNPGVTLDAMVLSHVPNAIALGSPVIIGGGFNDRRDLIADTNTFRQRYDSIIQPLLRAGITVYLSTMVPTNSTSVATNENFDIAIRNLATTYSLPLISIDSVLKKSGDAFYRPSENYLSSDAIHWSDSAQYLSSVVAKNILGNNLTLLFNDTTSPVKFYNIPTGAQNMNRLVVDNKGEVYQVPNIPFDGIKNAFNSNGSGTTAQPAEIHISKTIKTDSALFVHTTSGVRIGGNGGTDKAAGTSGSNFVVTTRGPAGVGYPQRFPTQSGLRQVVFEPFSLKTGVIPTYSGNDIFLMAMGNATGSISGSRIVSFSGWVGNAGTLSGSDNYFMTYESGKNITTGTNNFHAVTRNSAATSFANSLTGTTIIGDILNQTSTSLGNQEIWLSSGNSALDQVFRFGGGGGADNNYFYVSPTWSGSNRNGSNWYFRSSAGRGTGTGGNFIFQTYNAAASGTTQQTSLNTELSIYRDSIQIDALAKFNSQIQVKVTTGISAASNYTVLSTDYYFELPDLAGQANRTVTLPTNTGTGRTLIIKNKDSDGTNSWSFSVAVKDNADGDVTALTDDKVYHLVWNGTNWVITMIY